MIVRLLTTFHKQYNFGLQYMYFLFNRTNSKFLLHALQVLYMCTDRDSTNRTAIETIKADMLQTVWNEFHYRVDVCNKNLECSIK